MKIEQLPGESDYNFQQRVKAIQWLGDKWLLANKIQKPASVEWKC